MPKGSRVARCVRKVVRTGLEKPNAIRICQQSTGLSYVSGAPPKGRRRKSQGK